MTHSPSIYQRQGHRILGRSSSGSAVSVEILSKLAPELQKDLLLILRFSDDCRNSQYRKRISTCGIDFIDRHCNWETQIQMFEQMLESLISDE